MRSEKESLAFIIMKANDKNGYDSQICCLTGGEVLPLAEGSAFIWDDEDTILFKGGAYEEDKKAVERGEECTVFSRIPCTGGQPEKAFSIPLNVTKIEKISNKKYLLTVRYDLRFSKLWLLDGELKEKLLTEKENEKDFIVVDETPFRADGAGWTNGKRTRLFLYDESSAELKPVTEPESFTINSYALIDSGKRVAVVGDDFTFKKAGRPGVFIIDIETGRKETMIDEETMAVDTVCPYRNGLLIAATKAEKHGWNERPDFYKYDLSKKELSFVSSNEFTLHTGIRTDVLLGAVRANKSVGDTFYTGIIDRYEGPVMRLADDGSLEKVVSVNGNINDFDISGDYIYYTAMEGTKLEEIYRKNLKTGSAECLTSINSAALDGYYIAEPHRIDFENDNVPLTGWILFPKDYEPGKKYPAILDIHGGPCITYGERYYHEMQVWAGEGYFVFYCNPRGSDGRGEDFSDIRGKTGTIDYDDIMKFTDVVLESFPDIDKDRVGVTGGSYGGFMTNRIIGHTDRFACAASQRSISNRVSQNVTSDFSWPRGFDSVPDSPWEDIKASWNQSPLQFADRCKTPTLFIHSTEDFRCPIQEGIGMFNSIALNETQARMCIFKGESHALASKGKPLHRVRRLREITEWMNRFLKKAD